MAKRPSLKAAVKAPSSAAERAQAAAKVAHGLSQPSAPKSPSLPAPEAAATVPSRTVSYHVPDDLASLIEDLADARFRLLRAQREAVLRAGGKWEGGKVRRSASGVVADAFEAQREAMAAELAEIERELRS